ncbi:hypothetical protein A2V49_01700 [candidate division WWE3 bacterium RBG_19FT_COMBO_34_6]|uniref:Carbohydrate kinase PfkB domain-containing protein n=1 Tax=candidate division WWE3 bacterium RBG_19FT_COMBO_34_6 TaxID=1802612 RepID=A0A1F4UK18_UNCKA|nr:MAG: hypothetical protein A2V49_01700 [candidate division WWE3 bacterium RBG_19FT_COMBO_34_6]
MTNSLDLLAIGDVCIDLYLKVEDKDATTDKHSVKPKICFYHGSKIPVKSLKTNIAGNAVNIAVGATKLGMKSAIYTEMGDDEYADRIVRELDTYDIDTSLMHRNKDAQTGLHPVIVYGGDRTIFSHHEIRHYKVSNWPETKWIYYTSISPGFESFQKNLVKYVKDRPQVGVAFNPGTFHMQLGLAGIKNFLEITHVLFVNREEAIVLVGDHPLEMLHHKLRELGPKLTVITLGSEGASGFDGNSFVKIDAYKINKPVIDKTGAGDAFAIGVIAALHYKKSLKEALFWGAIDSSFQIREIGSTLGLVTKNQIEEITSEHKNH